MIWCAAFKPSIDAIPARVLGARDSMLPQRGSELKN
jgi:hypothetical protein